MSDWYWRPWNQQRTWKRYLQSYISKWRCAQDNIFRTNRIFFSVFFNFRVAVYHRQAMKQRCHHFDDILITGCTGDCLYPTSFKGPMVFLSPEQFDSTIRLWRLYLIIYAHNWPFNDPIKLRDLTITFSALTSVIIHGSFSNVARTFIALWYRTSLILEVLSMICVWWTV